LRLLYLLGVSALFDDEIKNVEHFGEKMWWLSFRVGLIDVTRVLNLEGQILGASLVIGAFG
jgi:hypothetical protein